MSDFIVERFGTRQGRVRGRSFVIRDASGRIRWRGDGFSPPTVDGDYRERAIEIALRALRGQRPEEPTRERLDPDQYLLVADWQQRNFGKAA